MSVNVRRNEEGDVVDVAGNLLTVQTYTALAADDVEYVVNNGKVVIMKCPAQPNWIPDNDGTWLALVDGIENP